MFVLFQFREHTSQRRYLFKTYPNVLVYCSPTSTYWGVGLSKGEKEVHDPAKWKGKNKLGELMTKIRDEMMLDQNLVFDVPPAAVVADGTRGKKRPLAERQLEEAEEEASTSGTEERPRLMRQNAVVGRAAFDAATAAAAAAATQAP